MADEIQINIKAAEEALRQLDGVMQEWQQEQAGIREALHGVMDGQQAEATSGLGTMIDDFADKRMERITGLIEMFSQGTRTFLETFRQEDAEAAQDIRGDR